MKKILLSLLIISIAVINVYSASAVRIKDLAQINGIRDNQLQGFGLVTGLDGSGDSKKALFTINGVVNLLKSQGITVDPSALKVDNIAAVIVTATLPPFVKNGQKIDVTVSSLGDAEDLQGGILLQTPLQAADGKVYAVAQGAVSIGGFNIKSGGGRIRRNHPTVGRIPNGAIIEREVPTDYVNNGKIELLLNNPDFSTASKMINVINSWSKQNIAGAKDANSIDITVPSSYENNIIGFIAGIENLTLTPENKAKVVVNTRTGTIVFGSNVKLSEVAVAHQNLSVIIKKTDEVSQPPAFGAGTTTVTQKVKTSVEESGEKKIMHLNEGSTINDVVKALNKIGSSPRDIISILQALKDAGALHAELELM